LEKFGYDGIDHIRIRNSGQTIEDCTVSCEKEICFWTDTNIDKPRHVFEGSVSVVRLPAGFEKINPLITVKSGKKVLKRINLEEMAHG